MDLNKIFGLFSDEEPKSLKEKSQLIDDILDFKEHPLFWVGMFKKLIQNHKLFNKEIIGFFSILDQELDIDDVEQAGEFVVYNKAFSWIDKININNKLHQNSILKFSDDTFLSYLKISISYFEKFEEYEKCAHLKNIQNIVEEFLN
jgi:hypothetical protein